MFLSLRLQRLAHQIHLPRPSCISVIPAGHQEDVMKTSRKHVYPYYPYTSIYRIIQDHKYLLPTGLLTPQPSKALLWCREVRATAQAYIASHRQKMAKVWVRVQACFFFRAGGTRNRMILSFSVFLISLWRSTEVGPQVRAKLSHLGAFVPWSVAQFLMHFF
jgi:hypothetical protein